MRNHLAATGELHLTELEQSQAAEDEAERLRLERAAEEWERPELP